VDHAAHATDLIHAAGTGVALTLAAIPPDLMGGLGFMIGEHMALGIVGEEMMVRVGPDGYQRALRRVHAREMDFTGRSIKGFVFVEPAGTRTKRSLASWVAPAVAFAKSLQ